MWKYISLLFLSFIFFTPFLALGQKRLLLICPFLKEGTYQTGQLVLNSDGKPWRLSIQDSTGLKLNIKNWEHRQVRPSKQAGFILICDSIESGKIIQAQYSVPKATACYVIPDVEYPLFGCF